MDNVHANEIATIKDMQNILTRPYGMRKNSSATIIAKYAPKSDLIFVWTIILDLEINAKKHIIHLTLKLYSFAEFQRNDNHYINLIRPIIHRLP